MNDPRQGEVWWVDFDPVVGDEVRKARPAIVVSRGDASILALRLVVPLTTWQERFARHRSKVRITPSPGNGLRVLSAADAMQLRSVSVQRFGSRAGVLETTAFDRLHSVIAFVCSPDSRTSS